ncbi:HEAT repeat-containing protein OS=Streptomyces microflavus OX=1919 GN=G3I39_41920 PE=4 SV=1 [Streptomyces microflavus]
MSARDPLPPPAGPCPPGVPGRPPAPPEGTPPRTELARQARAVLADAVRIAHWAAGAPAPGSAAPLATQALERAATALELSPAQVRAGWDRARLAGLIELHGDTARPGWRLRAWDRDDSAVLRGWVALFDAWSLVHAAPEGIETGAVAEAVEAVPQVLSLLQLSAGPVSVPALLDLLAQRIAELHEERCEVPYGAGRTAGDGDQAAGRPTPAQDRGADLDALLLDWALEGLAAVGALTLGNGHATLTPLGNWAVWVKLEQICVAAQSPAGNIEQSAADMLLGCARLTPGPARDEYRAWLAARTVGSAVAELLAVARGEDALLRGLAFEALRVVGAPAEPEVRAVVTSPSLRPYALLWLAEYEGADPDDAQEILSREEATWLWVDTAAAVADHGETGLLVRHLDSAVQGTVPALLDEVRAVGHPRTVQVLVALAAAHPDPALAKAVRRAAFQVHTGGA